MRLRYGPVRVHLLGDTVRARAFLPEARRIFLRAQEWWRMSPGGPIARNVKLAAGVDCTVRIAAGHVSIYVHAEPTITLTPRVIRPTRPEVWVPRGFVVYPANASNRTGWGLPVVPDAEDADPFAEVNRRPGLGLERWTPGGPLGQVLLTQVPGAGYPADDPGEPTAPMFWSDDYGWTPTLDAETGNLILPGEGSEWAAYRIEFAPMAAQTAKTDDPTIRAALRSRKREIWDLINDHRESINLDRMTPPHRGQYDMAQATAEIVIETKVMGHMYDGYPDTYKTSEDRMSKNGMAEFRQLSVLNNRSLNYGEIIAAQSATTPVSIGVDANGTDIWQITPTGSPISPQAAFDGWMDSPGHRAMIEDSSRSFNASLHVGTWDSAAAAFFVSNDQWVHAGSRQWVGNNGLSLSYYGFSTVNLAWETWRVTYAAGGLPGFPADDFFDLSATDLDAPNGMHFWMQYRVYAGAGDPPRWPALGPNIYFKGRCVALAPNRGYVLAAAIQTTDDGHRLVAITHHTQDQHGDIKGRGQTSNVRVWWCNLPDLEVLATHQASLIRGVRGVAPNWPWESDDDEWAWQGGTLVDVNHSGLPDGDSYDLLKYASMWEFDPEGRKAICLRDWGTYARYRSLWISTGDTDTIDRKDHGLPPMALEMSLDDDGVGGLTVTLDVLGRPQGGDDFAVPEQVDDPEAPYWNGRDMLRWQHAIAAGYDRNGNRQIAYMSCLRPQMFSGPEGRWYPTYPNEGSSASTSPTGEVLSYLIEKPMNAHYEMSIGWGDWDTPWEDCTDKVLLSQRHFHQYTPDAPPYCNIPSILSVRDRAFLVFGVAQTHMTPPPGNTSSGVVNDNVDWCWVEKPDNDIVNVRMYRGATKVSDNWYGVPDGVVPHTSVLCSLFVNGLLGLPHSAQPMVLPSYAVHGADWVMSYVYQPQMHLGLMGPMYTDNEGPSCPEEFPMCMPTFDNLYYGYANYPVADRGGVAVANFAGEQELFNMMAVGGDTPRLLYARAT